MKKIATELQRHRGEACVSILLKTHRRHPENQQDAIVLKNLIKEAEGRLLEEHGKEMAQKRTAQLETLSGAIDFNRSLDGLLLVAGDGIAEAVPLPVVVESRVVIDDNFATRDLVRAVHDQSAYYILVLSQKQVRLVLAFSDRMVEELGNPFPIDNDYFHPKSRDERANAGREDQFIDEFFNRVDKQVQESIKSEGFPLVVAADRRNYDRYRSVADKQVVIAHLPGSFETEKSHVIVQAAWPIVKAELASRNEKRIDELRQAVSQQKFLSDVSDIWKAIQEGRGRTLFVERGYFQPAKIQGTTVVPVESPNSSAVVDDIVDEMVELNMQRGGDVVFLDPGSLDDFQGVALVTRY